jgi:hypothetical protein
LADKRANSEQASFGGPPGVAQQQPDGAAQLGALWDRKPEGQTVVLTVETADVASAGRQVAEYFRTNQIAYADAQDDRAAMAVLRQNLLGERTAPGEKAKGIARGGVAAEDRREAKFVDRPTDKDAVASAAAPGNRGAGKDANLKDLAVKQDVAASRAQEAQPPAPAGPVKEPVAAKVAAAKLAAVANGVMEKAESAGGRVILARGLSEGQLEQLRRSLSRGEVSSAQGYSALVRFDAPAEPGAAVKRNAEKLVDFETADVEGIHREAGGSAKLEQLPVDLKKTIEEQLEWLKGDSAGKLSERRKFQVAPRKAGPESERFEERAVAANAIAAKPETSAAARSQTRNVDPARLAIQDAPLGGKQTSLAESAQARPVDCVIILQAARGIPAALPASTTTLQGTGKGEAASRPAVLPK